MVPSTYRALKFEYGEKDILGAKKFNVQLFDFFECYNPVTKTPYSGQAGKQVHLQQPWAFIIGQRARRPLDLATTSHASPRA